MVISPRIAPAQSRVGPVVPAPRGHPSPPSPELRFARRTARSLAGAITAELICALSLVALTLIPVSFSFLSEQKLFRACYSRAVAMEIVDGEWEALLAGEWRAFKPGAQPYTVRAEAATNLPPGQFLLTIEAEKVRLEWRPARRDQGGPVVRETRLPSKRNQARAE
jgi:hypothetical protein